MVPLLVLKRYIAKQSLTVDSFWQCFLPLPVMRNLCIRTIQNCSTASEINLESFLSFNSNQGISTQCRSDVLPAK